MKKTAFAIALATLGLTANAAVISYDAALNLQTTEISQTLSLQKFDSSLGTLESVQVELFGRGVSTVSLTNTAAQEQDFGFASTLRLAFAGPLSELIELSLFDIGMFPADPVSIGSGEIINLRPVDVSNSVTKDVTADLFLSYIGTDTLDFTCRSRIANTTDGAGGNLTIHQATEAGCGATVTYTYTASTPTPNPVPEPGSVALLGLGLAGLGVLRRKKA